MQKYAKYSIIILYNYTLKEINMKLTYKILLTSIVFIFAISFCNSWVYANSTTTTATYGNFSFSCEKNINNFTFTEQADYLEVVGNPNSTDQLTISTVSGNAGKTYTSLNLQDVNCKDITTTNETNIFVYGHIRIDGDITCKSVIGDYNNSSLVVTNDSKYFSNKDKVVNFKGGLLYSSDLSKFDNKYTYNKDSSGDITVVFNGGLTFTNCYIKESHPSSATGYPETVSISSSGNMTISDGAIFNFDSSAYSKSDIEGINVIGTGRIVSNVSGGCSGENTYDEYSGTVTLDTNDETISINGSSFDSYILSGGKSLILNCTGLYSNNAITIDGSNCYLNLYCGEISSANPITINEGKDTNINYVDDITIKNTNGGYAIDGGEVNFYKYSTGNAGKIVADGGINSDVIIENGLLVTDKIEGDITYLGGAIYFGDPSSLDSKNTVIYTHDRRTIILIDSLVIKKGEKFVLSNNTTYVIFNGVTVEPGGVFDCSRGKVATYEGHDFIVQGGGEFIYDGVVQGGVEIDDSETISPTINTDNDNSSANLKIPAEVNSSSAKVEITSNTMSNAVDKILEDAKKNGNSPVINVDVTSSAKYDNVEVDMSTKSLDKFSNNSDSKITISSNVGEVSFDSSAIKTMISSGNDVVTLKFEKVPDKKLSTEQKNSSNGQQIYNLSVSVGNQSISYLGKGSVTVKIPYTLEKGKNPNAVIGYFMDSNGNKYECTTVYNEKNGFATIKSNFPSMYLIDLKEIPVYEDTFYHFARDDIDFVAVRGLMFPYSDDNFYPDNSITRAELAVTFAKLAKVNKNDLLTGFVQDTSFFEDVDFNSSSAGYINWVSQNKIMTPKSPIENKFNPNDIVTREEFAVSLARFIEKYSSSLPKIRAEYSFNDYNSASNNAKDIIVKLKSAGILEGKENNNFEPNSPLTRAELAMNLKRYLTVTLDKSILYGWTQNDAGLYRYYEDDGRFLKGNNIYMDKFLISFDFKGLTDDYIYKNVSKYLIEKDDTLQSIADKFYVDIYLLSKVNNIPIDTELSFGQKINIPK